MGEFILLLANTIYVLIILLIITAFLAVFLYFCTFEATMFMLFLRIKLFQLLFTDV